MSHTIVKKENCFNTEILIADLGDLNNLRFENYFSYNECSTSGNNQHGGGRMVQLKDGSIALTIGDYGFRDAAQDVNSIFGKIIIINKEDQQNSLFKELDPEMRKFWSIFKNKTPLFTLNMCR